MPRKKVSTNENDLTGVAELDDDEQLVVSNTTTKTIRRERRPPDVPAAIDTITVEPDDDDLFEPEPIEQPAYSPTSLAALLYGSDGEQIENQYCTVNVRRNPDSLSDRFAKPCSSNTHLPRLANIDLTADRADIEDRVRSEYGGGHYFFQIHFNGRLGPSWQATLADLPEHLRQSVAPAPIAAEPAVVPAAVNPFDQMFEALSRQKQMKDMLFGETEQALKDEIARLKDEIANRPAVPPEPQSERLAILEKALGVQNPTIQQRMLENVFPSDEGGHWLPETIKTIFEHKEELAGLAGMLLGNLIPRQPTAPAGNIAALMRSPAPAAIAAETVPVSRLTRKRPEPAPAETPAGNVSDPEPDAIDADEATEPATEPAADVPRFPVLKPGVGGGVAVIDDELTEIPDLITPAPIAEADPAAAEPPARKRGKKA